jgi:hypothetical protein
MKTFIPARLRVPLAYALAGAAGGEDDGAADGADAGLSGERFPVGR